MRKLSLILLLPVFILALVSFRSFTGGDWVVPAKYETMKNPLAGDKASVVDGKALYMLHCKSCHGKEGLGDGVKAAQLETPCGDFSEDLSDQSDGALYYKTVFGRGDMPSFEKKIPDANDVWSIVNFLRTME